MKKNSSFNTYKLTSLAMLTALVAILSYIGSFIRLSPQVTVSLTLVPIVIGAVLFGMGGGSWLGLVSALVILLSGQAAGFMITPAMTVATVVVVIAKGTLCGLVAALCYRLFAAKHRYLGVILAAVSCPVVNTGIYLIGCVTVFLPTVQSWVPEASTFLNYMIFGMGLINFPFELLFNIILCPVIYRLIKLLPRVE